MIFYLNKFGLVFTK